MSTAWQLVVLREQSGNFATLIRLLESLDEDEAEDERTYRLWCNELFTREAWGLLVGVAERRAIRIAFPADQYSGMPPYADLERSRTPQPAQLWRLIGPAGNAIATYVVESVELISHAQRSALELAMDPAGTFADRRS